MNYCQEVHDLRQCPVAVGSPQTQSQRDQVSRIIRIAETQEKRYRENIAVASSSGNNATAGIASGKASTPSRFTFEVVVIEGEHENGSPKSSNKARSESVDSNGSSVVPSHPIKKSSRDGGSSSPTESAAEGDDLQPQKYQAVEPARKSKKSPSSSDFPSICPPDQNSTQPAESTEVSVEATAASDRVTPVLQQGPAPNLDPTDKSSNETRNSSSEPPSPNSSWFWGNSQQPSQPKPPKENAQSSSSSWKGSLKGLRKWSSKKFKSPPASPDTGPRDLPKTESESEYSNGAEAPSGASEQVSQPEVVDPLESVRPSSKGSGRKWSLPNPLKKNPASPAK